MKFNPRLRTIQQLLSHLEEPHEGLMKECWEDCRNQKDLAESDDELSLVVKFLKKREKDLKKP